MALSCDTFVALPPATRDGCVIFGKNSDRPASEVQEVIYEAGGEHHQGSKVQCTYLELNQAPETYAIILSKPSWMWGAEIGANEHGVCIGNEALFTKMVNLQQEEGLTGMDLVRLGLERSKTAKEALEVITTLLVTHGQGGRCSDLPQFSDLLYDNSFLIADRTEAWVLETAGQFWVAERVTSGVRSISNLLTIGTSADIVCDGVKEYAKEKGLWSPDEEFHFAKTFCQTYTDLSNLGKRGISRYSCGKTLIEEKAKDGNFSLSSMMSILQDEPSGICMRGVFRTTGSQISVLYPSHLDIPDCHWFTGTPDPKFSVYKPFMFCDGASLGAATKSPTFGKNDPAKSIPRFKKAVNRKTPLHEEHELVNEKIGTKRKAANELLNQLGDLQSTLVEEIKFFIQDPLRQKKIGTKKTLFRLGVHREMLLYSQK